MNQPTSNDQRIYLNVPFSMKDDAKMLGAKFDNEKKKWYSLFNNIFKDELILKYGINETHKRHNLYVPFEYKDDVKRLGAKYDTSMKQWYILDNHENKQELIDLYHRDNFFQSFRGTKLRDNKMTLNEVQEMKKMKMENYQQYKIEWLTKNGNLNGFDEWYSVNILNHE